MPEGTQGIAAGQATTPLGIRYKPWKCSRNCLRRKKSCNGRNSLLKLRGGITNNQKIRPIGNVEVELASSSGEKDQSALGQEYIAPQLNLKRHAVYYMPGIIQVGMIPRRVAGQGLGVTQSHLTRQTIRTSTIASERNS